MRGVRRSRVPPPEAAIGITFGLMVTLTVIMSITAYSVDAFLPAFPAAAASFDAPSSALQLTLSAFLLGVAGGQLLFGPLSDRLGRRRPLIVGASICALAAVVAAAAPDVTTLIVARFVQGAAGSSGTVISRAIIRDRTFGEHTARALASLAVGMGALNIFSPLIGGLLLTWFGWRGPLWFLAAAAVVVLALVIVVVPETHPTEHRETGARWFGLLGLVRHLGNPGFVLYTLAQAGSYATLMVYVSSSPFVYQSVLGFDAAQYGLLFALNAAIGVAVNFIANRYLRRLGSKRLVLMGLGISMLGASLTALLWSLGAPRPLVAAAVTVSVASLLLNGPNLVALALNRVTSATGSAAATIGFVQFCAGSAVAPLVGLWGTDSLLPMCVAMCAIALGATSALLASRGTGRRAGSERGAG